MSLIDTIDTIDTMDCEGYIQYIQDTYAHIKTWDELIQTNINFLHGYQKVTFYHSSEFHDEFDDEKVWLIQPDLVRLNKEFQLFTHESQCSTKTIYNMILRGYVAFVCQKNSAFIERLLADDRIYTFAREESADGSSSIIHNCPEKITLTIPYGYKFEVKHYDSEANELIDLASNFPQIQSLLENAVHVFVFLREFPTENTNNLQVTSCILDALLA